MHPLTPVSEQERESYVDSSTEGGWGALVILVVLVAALALAIMFFGNVGGEQAPAEPVPSEAPVDPGY